MSISQHTLDDLYTSRTQRLKRMISAQMPRHMIMHECRLVIESCTGGHQALRNQTANRCRTQLVVGCESSVEIPMVVLQTVEIAHV